MLEVKFDAESRIKEIESYCNFIKLSDTPNSQIIFLNEITQNDQKEIISVEIKKILIANSFLLMYNLLESCVYQTINELYKHLNNRRIGYSSLDTIHKELYLMEKLSRFKNGNFNIKNLMIAVDELILNAVGSDPVKLEKSHDFSGNVDAVVIRETAKSHNIKLSKLNGDKLVDIKRFRNKLAHGNLTFTSVGQTKSIKDIIEYKDQLVSYLRKFMTDVETHISNLK